MLTKELLRNAIPALVWDAAIAGGWYRCASEAPENIFPEQLGHYWIWRDKEMDWKNLFSSEEREWLAWLLENPRRNAGNPKERVWGTPPESTPRAATASEDDSSFDVAARRKEALATYTQHWNCSEAALARTAAVNPADLSKWKKGLLPAESDKKRRIERALKNNEPPTSAKKKSPDF